jgi:D-alanyl-D-alanine dipeptidase
MNQFKTKTKLLILPAIMCLLFWVFVAAKPSEEIATAKKSELVELITLDSTFKLDIRYATSNNFIGRPVYSEARAFLQRPAAEALVKVNRDLKALGYGLLIFDGYRPWSVTKLFWDKTPNASRKFVANPKFGSHHNRGCAVDLSMYNIATGKEVEMPGKYDEMSVRSHAGYQGGTKEQRRLRDLLRSKMQARGFIASAIEWWHFDYKDWSRYEIQDIPFSEIK